MNEITLVNPPSPFLADPKMMPPLGLLYVAASLKAQGVKVQLEDLAAGLKLMPRATHYGISCTTPQFPDAQFILQTIKTTNPEAQVCIGGPHATLNPDECLTAGFDAVISGEGEYVTLDFLAGQRGIIKADQIKDLDALPFPDRSLLSDYDYRIDGERATTIITSRGCPYHCAFCCKTWQAIRFRSWENVVAELQAIRNLGYGGVMFYDDELLIRRERDEKIFRALFELDMVWRCFTRADLVNRSLAEFMSASGCREILLGIESGSNQILSIINKGVTVEENKKAIRILDAAGIRVKAAMIIGLPGESNQTLKETWNFCREVEGQVSEWDFTNFTPYPGSPIYEDPEKFDIHFDKTEIYKPYKGGKWESTVSTSHLRREELTIWREQLHRRFKGEVY